MAPIVDTPPREWQIHFECAPIVANLDAAFLSGMTDRLPTVLDVHAAARRIDGAVHRTPILTSATLDRATGRRVLLKAEHLQKTGSYKARGAMNHMVALAEMATPVRGVVAASSGNHGQAVAWAAARQGFPSTVVVPASIAAAKRAAMEAYGARVVVVGESSDERLSVARELASREGLYEVPPYDHPLTIAGQGTVALEACEQIGAEPLEAAVVAVSGGGLAAGCGLALAEVAPEVKLYGVEPAGADDTRQSLEAGRRIAVEPTTIADALRARQPGELTFELNRQLLSSVLTVSDLELRETVRFLAQRTKQVVEYGGAAALGAVIGGHVPGSGSVLVVLSGGNFDLADIKTDPEGLPDE